MFVKTFIVQRHSKQVSKPETLIAAARQETWLGCLFIRYLSGAVHYSYASELRELELVHVEFFEMISLPKILTFGCLLTFVRQVAWHKCT